MRGLWEGAGEGRAGGDCDELVAGEAERSAEERGLSLCVQWC